LFSFKLNITVNLNHPSSVIHHPSWHPALLIARSLLQTRSSACESASSVARRIAIAIGRKSTIVVEMDLLLAVHHLFVSTLLVVLLFLLLLVTGEEGLLLLLEAGVVLPGEDGLPRLIATAADAALAPTRAAGVARTVEAGAAVPAAVAAVRFLPTPLVQPTVVRAPARALLQCPPKKVAITRRIPRRTLSPRISALYSCLSSSCVPMKRISVATFERRWDAR
jgi:hypothetical protein